MGSSATDEALQESVFFSLGGHTARVHSSLQQAVEKRQALADEVEKMKEQLAQQFQRSFAQEVALNEELGVLRKAKLDANKKIHKQGQEYATLLGKVVPLRVEIEDLKDALKEKGEKMANLEERSVTREVQLGKVESKLADKTQALAGCQQELAEKIEALAQAEEETTAQAEKAKGVEDELFTNASEAYGAGFEDALA